MPQTTSHNCASNRYSDHIAESIGIATRPQSTLKLLMAPPSIYTFAQKTHSKRRREGGTQAKEDLEAVLPAKFVQEVDNKSRK